jgi:hypothetical protein
VRRGDRRDRFRIHHLAVQVHGDDRCRGAVDRGLRGGRIDQQGVGTDIDESGPGTGRAHRFGRRDERVRRDDHLVTGADTEAAQDEF